MAITHKALKNNEECATLQKPSRYSAQVTVKKKDGTTHKYTLHDIGWSYKPTVTEIVQTEQQQRRKDKLNSRISKTLSRMNKSL